MTGEYTADKTARLTTTQVARLLGVSDRYVRELHISGELKDVENTPLGRLYDRGEVEALRDKRAG